MTATILPFPSPLERDQIEFDRAGASNFTRACDEAAALAVEVLSGSDREGLRQRVILFGVAIDHLARYRPDDLGNPVARPGGGWIELALLPAVLLALLDPRDPQAG